MYNLNMIYIYIYIYIYISQTPSMLYKDWFEDCLSVFEMVGCL